MPPERQPTSDLPLKNDVLLILLALAAEPLHGYAIMQRIEEDTGGQVTPQAGAFYRTIRNMLEDGLLDEIDDAAAADRDTRKRRHYRLTARGRAVAQAELTRMAALVRRGRMRDLAGRTK